MQRIVAVILLGIMLSGCAYRGALKMDCTDFASRTHKLPNTPLEAQIRAAGSDTLTDEREVALTMALAFAQPELDRLNSEADYFLSAPEMPGPSLLLSGGGQWGAFGVGLMNELIEQGKFPNFEVVTGVSTGALQALFVGAGMDRPGPEGAAMRKSLAEAYTPGSEKDVVDRESSQLFAVFTGALANLGPLKRRFEQRICPQIYAVRPEDRKGCAIPALRAGKGRDGKPRKVLLGMIEANSGEFRYVDVQELLAPFDDSDEGLEKATQCLAGAALASAAVPVFYQQVRVDGRTYYDGGVRQSVFLGSVIQARHEADRMVRERRRELYNARQLVAPASLSVPGAPPTIYVVRNGPTLLKSDQRYMDYPAPVDEKADALTAAMRSEAIMVNQLEVSSIASLRLIQPGGPIFFVSADGWENYTPVFGGQTCGKLKAASGKAMFSPPFMKCIMDAGRNRATGTLPWTELCPLVEAEMDNFCRDLFGKPRTTTPPPPRQTRREISPRAPRAV